MGAMRDAPLGTRVMLAVLVLLGLLAYAIVVDLGANAGKVHHGVTVEGFEVSGLTESDAFGELEARAEELEETGVVFRTGPLSFRFVPSDLNWGFKVDETTDRAMEVGRTGGPFSAVWDRARTWISGVEVDWAGSFFPRSRLANSLNSLEERAALFGYVVDRDALRRAMRAAIKELPRRSSYEIPLEGSD
jgi:hypothetical protein